MKNVLILTYAYYPIFHGGVPRVAAFCKYLQGYGWNPILLAHDSTEDTNFARTDKKDACKVVRIKTVRSKYENSSGLKRRLWLLKQMITHSFEDIGLLDFEEKLLIQAREICKTEKIDVIFASSLPQCVHRVAYKLSEEFNIPWVADHRDLVGQDAAKFGKWAFLQKMDQNRVIKRDVKYDRSAAAVVTVSQGLADLILKRAGCNANVIPNGFDEEDFKNVERGTRNAKLTVVYTGSLFGDRNIDIFLSGIQSAINENSLLKDQLEIDFYGPCCERVSQIISEEKYHDLDGIIVCKGSVSHEEAVKCICNADVLYLISHPAKGIATGKIYEYFAAQRTILSVPGDGDITDKMLRDCNSGFVASTEEEVKNKLLALFEQWSEQGKIAYAADENMVNKYNRKIQTGELAKIFNDLC